ncbi:tRNA (guanosine(18)-2'-O)-methyltransferase TrmH [soil metagenome]
MSGSPSKNAMGPRAVDRKELSKASFTKTTKWPRTDRRVSRLESALRHRQPDLAVVLENVHDLHNVSAVMRTCDAVGIQTLHLINSYDGLPENELARRVSAGTAKWLDCVRWQSVEDCYGSLRDEGMRVLATALTETAHSIFEQDFSQPAAVVFGNEMRGLSDEAISQADGGVYIPMVGMVQSLNISVSCAVTLYEVHRQRLAAGAYDSPRLSQDIIDATLEQWLKR